MWASVTFMPTRQNNPRTEVQYSQRRQCSDFARNCPVELISICSNRMARKCEQASHSCEKEKPMHVRRYSIGNDVSAPSSLGMDPVSWFTSDQIEWQANVSKRDIHANKKNKSTYGGKVSTTSSFLRVRSEWNPWVDYILMEQNGKEMWAGLTFIPTRKTIHVRKYSWGNDVSAPSSLGIVPVSLFSSVQIEWQWNVSKRDIHANNRQNNAHTEVQYSQQRQFSEFARNCPVEFIINWWNRMARKCEQAWHSCQQKTNQYTYKGTYEAARSVPRVPSELTPWVGFRLFKENGKYLWDLVRVLLSRQNNARTEVQYSQQRQFSEFARNWTRELISLYSNRMASKCEQAWHSCQQEKQIHVRRRSLDNNVSSPSSLGIEPVSWLVSIQIEWQGNMSKRDIHADRKPIHVRRNSWGNDVSAPSSLGIDPVSLFSSVQIEWQGNVSKRGIHAANKTNQCTYGGRVESTTSVLRVRLELNRWVDYILMEQNGQQMWASVTFMPTRKPNPRTEVQLRQRRQCSEFARNWPREFIVICSNRMARKCEQAWHWCPQKINQCTYGGTVESTTSVLRVRSELFRGID
jgi:hypothetical protein